MKPLFKQEILNLINTVALCDVQQLLDIHVVLNEEVLDTLLLKLLSHQVDKRVSLVPTEDVSSVSDRVKVVNDELRVNKISILDCHLAHDVVHSLKQIGRSVSSEV